MRYFIGIAACLILGLTVCQVSAEILDISDGQYFSWTGEDGLDPWDIYAWGPGVSVTISDANTLHILDESSTNLCYLIHWYELGQLWENRYIIQFDMKWIYQPDAPYDDHYFVIDDGVLGTPAVRFNFLNQWYGNTYAELSDQLGDPYDTSEEARIQSEVWYRYVLVKDGETYNVRVQNMDTGDIIIDATRPIWGSDPDRIPDGFMFDTGNQHAGPTRWINVHVDNIKVGRDYTWPELEYEDIILDLSDGRYWSWDAQTGVLGDWDLQFVTGGSTATIEDGALRLYDPGADAMAQAFGHYGAPLTVTDYVIQWDQKVISDGSHAWFSVQDRAFPGQYVQRINTRIDATAQFARVVDAVGGFYTTGGYINHGEWYRFIVVRTGDNYTITVQRLLDGFIELNEVLWAVNNPGVAPNAINFSTGMVNMADSAEVYINNVKVGKDRRFPENCEDVHLFGYGYLADINKDCRVDYEDIAAMAAHWLMCNIPGDEDCIENW